jgi:predicted alpha-1,2-mannosidase
VHISSFFHYFGIPALNRLSMKIIARLLLLCIVVPFFQFCDTPPVTEVQMQPLEKVDPYIGAISHMLVPTFPTVHLPNSMVRIHPSTTPGIRDNYLAARIYDFAINIPSHRRDPFGTVMITANMESVMPVDVAAPYDTDFGSAAPHAFSVLLEDPDVLVEYTATPHGALYRFKAYDAGTYRLLFRCSGKGLYRAGADGGVEGADMVQGLTQYTYAHVDVQDYTIAHYDARGERSDAPDSTLEKNCTVLQFALDEGQTLTLRTGISYISPVQAKKNFEEETEGKSYERLVQDAAAVWNTVLGSIRVVGGTDDQQTVFYTSLYRCFERMVNITEDGRYYSAFDGRVHDSKGRDFYTDDWIWDTYRSLHPLRMILFPDMENDMLHSYVRMYQQSGWVPSFPTVFGEHGAMIGHHQAAYFADAWHKGLRDYDMHAAYEGLLKNAMEGTRIPWREGPMSEIDKIYLEKGFFPALVPGMPETDPNVHPFERRQAVAVSLEHAYDDWALSTIAAALGKNDVADALAERGMNYRKLFHPDTKLVTGRAADGAWIEPYDPKMPAGPGGREFFAESNAYVYSWFAPHDVYGIVDILGGREQALQRLDGLYNEPPGAAKHRYLGMYPDDTGLTGLFHMGNEPAFHIPYLYNYMGVPWKTQKRVRQLMRDWFRNDLMGVCGDEDGGALSAWYVFSAMGFYPVCPGQPVYMIGSPIFEEIRIALPGGKTFTIRAKNASRQNKYIQSATLNGSAWNHSWITHDQIVEGGEMQFDMGPRPNTAWAAEYPIDPRW